jgi:hypothetical protein
MLILCSLAAVVGVASIGIIVVTECELRTKTVAAVVPRRGVAGTREGSLRSRCRIPSN